MTIKKYRRQPLFPRDLLSADRMVTLLLRDILVSTRQNDIEPMYYKKAKPKQPYSGFRGDLPDNLKPREWFGLGCTPFEEKTFHINIFNPKPPRFVDAPGISWGLNKPALTHRSAAIMRLSRLMFEGDLPHLGNRTQTRGKILNALMDQNGWEMNGVDFGGPLERWNELKNLSVPIGLRPLVARKLRKASDKGVIPTIPPDTLKRFRTPRRRANFDTEVDQHLSGHLGTDPSALHRFAWETHPLKPVYDYSEFLNRFRMLRDMISSYRACKAAPYEPFGIEYVERRHFPEPNKLSVDINREFILDRQKAIEAMKAHIAWLEPEFHKILKYLKLWRIFDSKEMWEGVTRYNLPGGGLGSSSSIENPVGPLNGKGEAASMLWLRMPEWRTLSLDAKLEALAEGKRLGGMYGGVYVNFERWWEVCETFIKKAMADVYWRWRLVHERAGPVMEAYVTGKIRRWEMKQELKRLGISYPWYFGINPFVNYGKIYDEMELHYPDMLQWFAECLKVVWPGRVEGAPKRPGGPRGGSQANVLVRLPDEVLEKLGKVVVTRSARLGRSGGRRQKFKMCEVKDSQEKQRVWRCSRTQCNGAWLGVVYRLPKGMNALPAAVRNILQDAGYRATQMRRCSPTLIKGRAAERELQVYGFFKES